MGTQQRATLMVLSATLRRRLTPLIVASDQRPQEEQISRLASLLLSAL